MNRILLSLVPDKSATLLASVLSAIAFLLGLLDMLTRDFGSARFHLNLSIGIFASLFLIRFFSLQAAYSIADHAQESLRHRIMQARQTPLPALVTDKQEQEQALALELADMAELAGELKHALNRIPVDSPVRPKYEATLALTRRYSRRASAHPS